MMEWHGNSLRLTNALIGMTRPDASWCSPLADLGYRVHWLERRLTGAAGACQPDIIMSCVSANHALLFEVKCGTLQVPQHASYAALTATDLRDGGIPDMGGTPFSFDVAYATGSSTSEALAMGLREEGVLPLLIFSDELIQGDVAPFADADVEMVFGGAIDISEFTPPMGYVAFNEDSTDLEVMNALLPSILASLRRGDAQLTTDELIRSAMPYWDSFAQQSKGALARRVDGLLRRQAQHFAEFFDYVGADVPHRLAMKCDLSRVVGREMYEVLGRWDVACAACLTDLGALVGQLPLFE